MQLRLRHFEVWVKYLHAPTPIILENENSKYQKL